LIQRPAVRATLRALNLAGGLVLAAVAFVVLGFVAAITICTGDETTGLCVHHAGLIPYVEWTTVGTAVLAPLAAGVVAFMRRQPAWLLVGAAVAGVLFLLLLQVVAGQSSALS
jgi:hypothetical protein